MGTWWQEGCICVWKQVKNCLERALRTLPFSAISSTHLEPRLPGAGCRAPLSSTWSWSGRWQWHIPACCQLPYWVALKQSWDSQHLPVL